MTSIAPERLADVFVEVADTLVTDFDVIEFLQTVTTHAVELVDASAAGLLLSDHRGGLHFMAASDERTKLLERIPAGRMGTPEDIGAAVVYLASAEAAWVTGQTLHVNGGMAMI